MPEKVVELWQLQKKIALARGWKPTHHEQWKHPTKEGGVPRWPFDPDAALELLREMNEALALGDYCYGVGYNPGGKVWCVMQTGPMPDIYDFAPTAAEAICRAWLAWHETLDDHS